jgi:hypothetical protein
MADVEPISETDTAMALILKSSHEMPNGELLANSNKRNTQVRAQSLGEKNVYESLVCEGESLLKALQLVNRNYSKPY